MVTSVSAAGGRSYEKEMLISRKAESNISVTISLGQVLTIRTNAAPLNAFQWELLPVNSHVVSIVGARKLVNIMDATALGREVASEFKFVAKSKGYARLQFRYRSFGKSGREEELECEGCDDFIVNVCVK